MSVLQGRKEACVYLSAQGSEMSSRNSNHRDAFGGFRYLLIFRIGIYACLITLIFQWQQFCKIIGELCMPLRGNNSAAQLRNRPPEHPQAASLTTVGRAIAALLLGSSLGY